MLWIWYPRAHWSGNQVSSFLPLCFIVMWISAWDTGGPSHYPLCRPLYACGFNACLYMGNL
jgi:hypothetical protein